MPEYQVVGGRVVARGPAGTGTLEGLIADLQGMKAALALKAEKTELPEVLDALDSERTDAALSAAMGKKLNQAIAKKLSQDDVLGRVHSKYCQRGQSMSK